MNKKIILLVDDDANDVLLTQRALQKADLSIPVAVVDNGAAAIEYLSGTGSYADRERHPFPFLMLLDLKLPLKSGFEVLTWLRQQPGLKRLPVVVLTSSTRGADVEQAYACGANSYMVKPSRFEDFPSMMEGLKIFWLGLCQCPPMEPDCPSPTDRFA